MLHYLGQQRYAGWVWLCEVLCEVDGGCARGLGLPNLVVEFAGSIGFIVVCLQATVNFCEPHLHMAVTGGWWK